jgi:SWI/SNF-related matrix-associated actin-dependent regulator 1 of chromatin subfamily A
MKAKDIINNIIENPIKKRVLNRKLKPDKAYISENNGRIFIDHPFDQKLRKKYHFLNTIRWDSLLKKWELKKTTDKDTCQFLLEINKEAPQYSWEISTKAFNILNNSILDRKAYLEEARVKLRIKKKITNDLSFESMLVQPFPFQKVGIEFIEANDGIAYIGDSMGLGKTMQAIGYTTKNGLKTVVVSPASLKYNWEREINKFTNRKALVLSEYKIPIKEKGITSRKYNDSIRNYFTEESFDYIIINYEQLDKYKVILKLLKFDCVVLDESQYISNNQAKRTKAVFSIFSKIEKRILLSGTAIKNRPIEFYPQLKFLRGDLFPNKEKFGLRYCDAQENHWGRGYDYTGASNLRELHFKIAPFYIRRIKENVLKELPSKTINLLDLEFSSKEQSSYNKLKLDFKNDYLSKKGSTFSFLAKTIKIKQHLSIMKVQRVIEFADQLMEDDPSRKIIIFTQFKESQRLLHEHYKDISSAILAKYSSEKRLDQVDEFSNDPNKRILVASTKAGGIGFNITAADTVLFCDLLWNPADHEQAEDRAYRLGQKKKVSIYYMNYLNSMESMLWQILKGKEAILGQVLDGKEAKDVIDEKQVIKQFMKEFLKELKLKK